MSHWCSKGTAIFLVVVWETLIFFTAIDCELLCFWIFFLLTIFTNHSGDDPASICHVESIQKDSIYPFVSLCATCHCFLHPYWYL